MNLALALVGVVLGLSGLALDYGRYKEEIGERRGARLTPTVFEIPKRIGDPLTLQFTAFNTGNRDVAILALEILPVRPKLNWAQRPTGGAPLAATTKGLPVVLAGGRVAVLDVSVQFDWDLVWEAGTPVAPHRPQTHETQLWLVAKVADDRAVLLNQWHPIVGWYSTRDPTTSRMGFAGLSNRRQTALDLLSITDFTATGELNSFDPDALRQLIPEPTASWWSRGWDLVRAAFKPTG